MSRARVIAVALLLLMVVPAVARWQAARAGAQGAGDPVLPLHLGPDVSLLLEQGPTHITQSDQALNPATAGAERCDSLTAEGLRVTLADAQQADFCLVEQPNLDTMYVQLLNMGEPASFVARRQAAAAALRGAGVDPCRVTLWWVRRDAVRALLPVTDQYASPALCPPRVLAHDAAARAWTDFTTRTVRSALEQAEQFYGVRASMPLTVHLDGSRDAYAARVTAGQSSDDVRARLLQTEGVTARGTVEGAWIAIDTSRFSPLWPERAAFTIRHEVAHYIQTVAAGCACAYPVWFAEGMADLSAMTATGPLLQRHLSARATALAGREMPLRELASYPEGGAVGEVYDRGYTAASYLSERWGMDALAALVRAGQEGNPGAFSRALTTTTGLSLDELDRAVSRWLVNAVPEGPAAEGMVVRYAAAFSVYDPAAGRVEGSGSVFGAGSGQVDVVTAWDCAPGAHQVVTRWYRPDGSLYLEESVGGYMNRCGNLTRSRLSLTTARDGARPLDTPGAWRVEITADGHVVVAMPIVIGG